MNSSLWLSAAKVAAGAAVLAGAGFGLAYVVTHTDFGGQGQQVAVQASPTPSCVEAIAPAPPAGPPPPPTPSVTPPPGYVPPSPFVTPLPPCPPASAALQPTPPVAPPTPAERPGVTPLPDLPIAIPAGNICGVTAGRHYRGGQTVRVGRINLRLPPGDYIFVEGVASGPDVIGSGSFLRVCFVQGNSAIWFDGVDGRELKRIVNEGFAATALDEIAASVALDHQP